MEIITAFVGVSLSYKKKMNKTKFYLYMRIKVWSIKKLK